MRPLGNDDFDELDVAPGRIVDALGAAELGGGRERLGEVVALHAPLDLQLDRVGELVAVRPEQLDAVVLVRIVRGRDHDPEIAAHHARQHRDRRRRQRPQQHHVHAHGQEAGGERGLQHVAGEPRVLADDDAMPVVAAPEMRPRRQRQRQRRRRRDRLAIGLASDSIRPEQLARHGGFGDSPVAGPILAAVMTELRQGAKRRPPAHRFRGTPFAAMRPGIASKGKKNARMLPASDCARLGQCAPALSASL